MCEWHQSSSIKPTKGRSPSASPSHRRRYFMQKRINGGFLEFLNHFEGDLNLRMSCKYHAGRNTTHCPYHAGRNTTHCQYHAGRNTTHCPYHDRIQMQDGFYTFANYLVDTIVDALLHHWIVTGDWSILCPLEKRHSVRTVAVALAVARCGGGAHWRCLTLFPICGTEDIDVFNERPMFRAHLYEAKRLPTTVAK